MDDNKWVEINKALWNKKTDLHIQSEFYDQSSFIEGRNSLHAIELDILGNIDGLNVLHLQCHFGQDTMSLSRMGANATGVDLSDVSIANAQSIAADLGLSTQFICCNVYDIDQHLTDQYDIIFASYGTIGWLPDMHRYFSLVKQFLKSGGRFILVEFHPFMWIWDEHFSHIEYSYFNREPIITETESSYTDKSEHETHKEVGWNHDFGELFQAIKTSELQVSDFNEYDFSPYECFNNMVEIDGGFQLKGWEGKIPMLYSLVVTTA